MRKTDGYSVTCHAKREKSMQVVNMRGEGGSNMSSHTVVVEYGSEKKLL